MCLSSALRDLGDSLWFYLFAYFHILRAILLILCLSVFIHSCLQNILDGLALKNHTTERLTSSGAVVQAVVRYDKGLQAQSDPRKGGYAAGY